MTRKDYELIARAIDRARASIIKATRHDYAERALRLQGTVDAVNSLASVLADDNIRFDKHRFLAACIHGPLFVAASNEEALARNVGPGTAKG